VRNVVLSIVVTCVLVAGGIGGTFAGFVDTEESPGNLIQAGISDLLINGKNDPDVLSKIYMDCVIPGKSTDFWVDAFNWGKCTGGDLYMHFKDVVSTEAGTKSHDGNEYVYKLTGTNPDKYEYVIASGSEPIGAGVWSSEPEKGAEVGGIQVGNIMIAIDDPDLKGEDYASGIADNLGITVYVPYKGATGTVLGNPDTDDSGAVSDTEYTAWTNAGNRWFAIPGLNGTLTNLACSNVYLGKLLVQEKTYIHVDVVVNQILATMRDYDQDGTVGDADDIMLNWWPTNALQGDLATWTMMFALITDDPPAP
jgi:hypothetical protein